MTGTPIALTIAGSDSSGGAGIQADLKTFSAFGVYGASAITALTAQNTRGVTGVEPVAASFVVAQIEAVLADLDVGAIKTGMLANAGIVEAVVRRLREHGREAVVAIAVQERRVDRPGARHDLDRRVVLRLRPEAQAQRNLRAERPAAVSRAGQRDERARAMARAARRVDAVARREQVDVRRRGVGRDRGLPVVRGRAQELRADPAGGGLRGRRRLGAERAVGLGRRQRVEALDRELILLLDLRGSGAPGSRREPVRRPM